MTLQDLTKQESGLVIYSNEFGDEAIICNWSGFKGLPKVFVTGLLDIDADIPEVEGKHYDDLSEVFGEVVVIYNENDDELPASGTVYCISDEVTIIAPDGWH